MDRTTRVLGVAVKALWLVVALAIGGVVYQQATASTYAPPGSVRGSLLGPGR